MTESKTKKLSVRYAVSAVFGIAVFLIILFCAKNAFASTVYPSGQTGGYRDKVNIQNALNRSGNATLVKGKTYYLNGPIIVSSNKTINAYGAKIVCKKSILFNIPSQTKYKSIENFTLNGGYWCFSNNSGYSGSSIKLTHGKNINILNATIRHASASGHTLEFVACKNVTVSRCNIAPLGSSPSKTEESIQIDIATHSTAYFLEGKPFKTSLAKTLQNGATCKNITIENCIITGNRGVVANYAKKEGKKYLGKLHSNIKIRNCQITGLKGEGVALFNTKSATIKNNTIISRASGSGSSYTIGLHLANFGNSSSLRKGKIYISSNTIKGGRQALQIYSHTSAKYGTTIVKNNNLYCKRGKRSALKALYNDFKSITKMNNKTFSWNGR